MTISVNIQNLLKNIKLLAAVSILLRGGVVAHARVFLFCPAHNLADYLLVFIIYISVGRPSGPMRPQNSQHAHLHQ